MNKRRAASETALRERFDQAIAEGDLPATTCSAELAKFVTVLMHGMAVQAAGGATRDELCRVARIAMRAWPN